MKEPIQIYVAILNAIELGDINKFLHVCSTYPHLTTSLNNDEISQITNTLTAYLNNEPFDGEWHRYLIDTKLFKQQHLMRFFNEISMATANAETEVRLMISEKDQERFALPDCLIVNQQTQQVVHGLEFKHYKSPVPRIVPEPRFQKTSYEILTRDELKPHYQQFSWVSRVYTYSDFYLHGRSPQYYKMYWEHQKNFTFPIKQQLRNNFLLIRK